MSTGDYLAAEEYPAPRKRNAEATAAAIVEAARAIFGTRGYEGASTREIAQKAGVNVALLNRYFGSKAGLFAAAVPPTLTFDTLLEGDISTLGVRVAALFLAKEAPEGYSPMHALIRSAASPDVVPLMREAVHRQIIAPLAARMIGADAPARALLITTQLAGFDLWARVLNDGIALGPERDQLQARLGTVLQALIDGDG